MASTFTPSPPNLLTVTYRHREFVMYVVLRQELEALAASNASVYFGFFGICLGAAVTLGITFETLNLPEPLGSRVLVILIISVLLAVLFLLLWIRDKQRAKMLIDRIEAENKIVQSAEIR